MAPNNSFKPKPLRGSAQFSVRPLKHMVSYPSESELVAALDHHDELVRLCASGRLPFWDFCAAYDNFYWRYALDGHEADPAGQALLDKLADRIAPHRELAELVLATSVLTPILRRAATVRPAALAPMRLWSRLKLVAAGLPRGQA